MRSLQDSLLWLLVCSTWLSTAVAQTHYTEKDFATVEKIDIHTHIHTSSLDFVALAQRDKFRFVNMAVWTGQPEVHPEEHRLTYLQHAAAPDRTAPVCSFPIENWDSPDWTEETIAYLDQQFAKGAVGVKIWKNFGMELRDQNGSLVMVDHPKLDPVINHIRDCKKVLLGHLGEPKNCWLPLNEMTVNNDRSYFSEHPQYHMYLHPAMPSYEEQIAARDRMLTKHPDIRFVACHLASLEWSVDRIAAFLDQFPNAVVGVAGRMGQIQYQSQRDRERVISFFVTYQDRILYGTDTGVGPQHNASDRYQQVRAKWLRDWKYFNTSENLAVPELDDSVRGIELPSSVVDKIYRLNALRLFSESWHSLQRPDYSQQVAELHWMAGNWVSQDAFGSTEETWLAPKNGLMLGLNRSSPNEGSSSFEFLRIAANADGVFYYASPNGREPTRFRLISSNASSDGRRTVLFENKDNDFPQRIIYSAMPDGLQARIEGILNGERKQQSWVWQRATGADRR